MLFPKFTMQRAFLSGSAALMLLLPVWTSPASAQTASDSTSVADAARRAREQKKNAAKPARTLTNDDLPPAPAAAQPAAAPTGENTADIQPKPEGAAAPSKASASADAPAQTDTAARKHAEIEAALKRAKAELAQAQGELDVLQRKTALDSDALYSKPDYTRDTEGKARLDADAQQVNDKKSQVDDLKAKLAALQAELGEAAEAEKPAQQR